MAAVFKDPALRLAELTFCSFVRYGDSGQGLDA